MKLLEGESRAAWFEGAVAVAWDHAEACFTAQTYGEIITCEPEEIVMQPGMPLIQSLSLKMNSGFGRISLGGTTENFLPRKSPEAIGYLAPRNGVRMVGIRGSVVKRLAYKIGFQKNKRIDSPLGSMLS